MRFAAIILYFDCDQFILRTIENCAPFVEKIYVSYSPLPWAYNPEARERFPNTVNPETLKQSRHLDKVELVNGDWLTEEDQRNECVDRAVRDGFDYLIVQDADEFYLPAEFEKNIEAIKQEPDFPYYRNRWYLFWKNTRTILINRRVETHIKGELASREENVPYNYSAAFALNLRKGERFWRKRQTTSSGHFHMLPGMCHHLSFVFSDEEMYRKISTWGHTNDLFDKELWYRAKWLGWKPSVTNLHPMNPWSFTRAVKFEGEIPKQIEDFEPGSQVFVAPSLWDRSCISYFENKGKLRHFARGVKRKIKGCFKNKPAEAPTKSSAPESRSQS